MREEVRRSQKKKYRCRKERVNAAEVWGQPPPEIANRGHSVPSAFHGNAKVTRAFLAAQPIMQDQWDDVRDLDICGFLARDYWHPNLVDYADPRLLQAKASKYNEDNPS